MKIFFLLMPFLLLTIHADEIKRVDSIVHDITKLKSNYFAIEKELKRYKIDLEEARKKEKSYSTQIISLENEIKSMKMVLKTKESSLVSKNKIIVEKCVSNQTQEEENIFPQLIMKEAFKNLNSEKVVSFEASTFRVNKKAVIYNSINGDKIDEWEKATSFTSNEKSDYWIKITGFFIDKVWTSASTEMWIKSSDASLKVGVSKE